MDKIKGATTMRLFGLTTSAGKSVEIYGNGDLGNCILFKAYQLIHPELSANQAAEKSGIFKQSLWTPHKIDTPTSAEEFSKLSNAEIVTASTVFAQATGNTIADWFDDISSSTEIYKKIIPDYEQIEKDVKSGKLSPEEEEQIKASVFGQIKKFFNEFAANFSNEMNSFANELKSEIIPDFDENDFLLHNISVTAVNGEETIDMRKQAEAALSLMVSNAIQFCCGNVEESVSMILSGIESDKNEADAKLASDNFRQTAAQAQEAAQEAAQASVLPSPFVVTGVPVPVFNDLDINKYFVFDKFCTIPADHHEDLGKTLKSIIPQIEKIKEDNSIGEKTVFKFIQYIDPTTFVALKVNGRGEYLINKDAISLTVTPTPDKQLAVVLNRYGDIVKAQPKFFESLFGEKSVKKATANGSELLFPIYSQKLADAMLNS